MSYFRSFRLCLLLLKNENKIVSVQRVKRLHIVPCCAMNIKKNYGTFDKRFAYHIRVIIVSA